jgi:hypothetical protein
MNSHFPLIIVEKTLKGKDGGVTIKQGFKIFWEVMPHHWVKVSRSFNGMQCLHFQQPRSQAKQST